MITLKVIGCEPPYVVILSDSTIAKCLENNIIEIEPEPRIEQIQPASFDVRMGREVYDKKNDEITEGPIEPDIPYLGYTFDKITLPDNIGALLTGRSSIGRDHIAVHQTAGWIDPGFEGQITLEIYNYGNENFEYSEGQRLAQLLFFQVDRPTRGYDGQYQGQLGITE